MVATTIEGGHYELPTNLQLCQPCESDFVFNDKRAVQRMALDALGENGTPFPPTVLEATSAVDDLFDVLDGERIIIKHRNRDQQKGVWIVERCNDSDVHIGPDYIAQRFIDRPLLIDGFKFTIRLYVFAERESGRFFLHREGKLYHCTEPFVTGTRGALITSGYLPNREIERFPYSLSEYADRVGVEVFRVMWDRIVRDICVKIPVFIGPKLRTSDFPCLLLGLDVELDYDGRPWLLEINLMPDMVIKNDTDRVLKLRVMQDVDNLVNNRPMLDAIELTAP